MQDVFENLPEPLLDHVTLPVGALVPDSWIVALQVVAEPTTTEVGLHITVSVLGGSVLVLDELVVDVLVGGVDVVVAIVVTVCIEVDADVWVMVWLTVWVMVWLTVWVLVTVWVAVEVSEVVVTGGSVMDDVVEEVVLDELVVDAELEPQSAVPGAITARLPPTAIWSLGRPPFCNAPCTPHSVP